MAASAPSPTNATYASSTPSPSPSRLSTPSSTGLLRKSRKASRSRSRSTTPERFRRSPSSHSAAYRAHLPHSSDVRSSRHSRSISRDSETALRRVARKRKHSRSTLPVCRKPPTNSKPRTPHSPNATDGLSDTESERIPTPLPQSVPRQPRGPRVGPTEKGRVLVDLQAIRTAIKNFDRNWPARKEAPRSTIKCPICSTQLSSKGTAHTFVHHLYVHLPSCYLPFRCPAPRCPRQYTALLRADIRSHYERVHHRSWRPDLEGLCVHQPNYETFLGFTNLARAVATCYSCKQPIPAQEDGPSHQ